MSEKQYIDRDALEKYIRVEGLLSDLRQARNQLVIGKTASAKLERYINSQPTYTPAEIMAEMWVPVTERLPEEYTEVLVTDGDRVHIGGWYGRVADGPQWLNCTQDIGPLDVTHWMPLPQPPKKEGEQHDQDT